MDALYGSLLEQIDLAKGRGHHQLHTPTAWICLGDWQRRRSSTRRDASNTNDDFCHTICDNYCCNLHNLYPCIQLNPRVDVSD
jgi:hypothetical protein